MVLVVHLLLVVATGPLLLLLQLLPKTEAAIKLRQIRVPCHPLVGESHSLECDYSLAGENLYSIKWYKDQQEFYRYLPKENPPALSFPVKGTMVNLDRSDARSVHLTNITLQSAGLYQCEVSTEAPKFKTIAEDSLMTVVHPPATGPVLSLPGQKAGSSVKQGLRVGDELTIVCASPHSYPAARLKFYINDEIANDKTVHTLDAPNNKGVLKESRILLRLKLERRHFRYGELTVKCTSAIYEIFFKSQKQTFYGIDLGQHALGSQIPNSVATYLPNSALFAFLPVFVFHPLHH